MRRCGTAEGRSRFERRGGPRGHAKGGTDRRRAAAKRRTRWLRSGSAARYREDVNRDREGAVRQEEDCSPTPPSPIPATAFFLDKNKYVCLSH